MVKCEFVLAFLLAIFAVFLLDKACLAMVGQFLGSVLINQTVLCWTGFMDFISSGFLIHELQFAWFFYHQSKNATHTNVLV
jgi:hypothetical protein